MKLREDHIGFERAWIRQLYHEHQEICWHYGVDLSRPMIEITNARHEWGAWDARIRTLRVSAFLIHTHSWDVTLNVFKHEMAHQIVTDIFGAADGHGPVFDRACNMIGVPHEFRGSGGDLPRKLLDFRDQEIASEHVTMLEKVRKLLSLACSHNEHEALLAMEKAHQLIEKYNIERIEQDQAARFVYAIINHRRKRVENYQRMVCRILQAHFFVDVIYSYLYHPLDCRTYRTIELLGTVENVRIAEYVYYFLLNQMEVLWKRHKRKSAARSVGNKRSYRLGVLKGFQDKLDQQAWEHKRQYAPETAGPDTLSALICAKDKRLQAFRDMRFPRLSHYRTQRTRLHYGTYQAGMSDGRRIRIHKGIKYTDGNRGKLLNP
ncbi:MAG: SprT-like domain-containing protein [Thermodesulfobacteriota bacterium]